MTSHTLLHTASDMVDVISKWHSNILWVLERDIANATSVDEKEALIHAFDMFKELPYDTAIYAKEF
ncbi:hypothetical protein [Moraxella marmotae]|uniref:hypothetical protein n=1 Tax=Moraxella marmotae TaxID=3344520 RepID=UPI0035D424BD